MSEPGEHARGSEEDEVETYFRGYEQMPLTDDELDFIAWNEQHFGETLISRDEDAGRGP